MIKTIYRLSGNTLTNIPRDLQCAKAVNNVMGFAVTNMLNSINFVKQKKELVLNLNKINKYQNQISINNCDLCSYLI